MAGSIAHDFNNLLGTIRNHLYLLRSRVQDEAVATHVAAIERSIDAGVRETRMLLDFTHRTVGDVQSIDVRHALPAMQDLLAAAVGRSVDLRVDVEDSVPGLDAEAAAFELAVLNLVVASRSKLADGGTLTVTARGDTDGDGNRRYVVLDIAATSSASQPVKAPTHAVHRAIAQVRDFCDETSGVLTISDEAGDRARSALRLPAASAG